jgi:para-nitrobenzyl esterase
MDLEITTTYGTLRGALRGPTIQFRGVPYASTPVGPYRFVSPVPPAPWSGVREAIEHGPIPPQRASRLAAVVGNFSRPQSEDCLSLTITVPAPAPRRSRPVVVYLHGGAYQALAGSLDWFDGAELATRGDLVVVSVNYRLGPLGFLAAQPGGGDQGLRDMVAALRWVAREIHAFSGNPGQITVMGQSAGAHAILCMLAMRQPSGLFHRAILQSAPSGLPPFSDSHAAEVRAQMITAGATLDADPQVLTNAAETVTRTNFTVGDVTPLFVPVIDPLADASRVLAAAVDGAAAERVETLIGTTRDEAHAFFCAPSGPAAPDLIALCSAIERLEPKAQSPMPSTASDARRRLSGIVTRQLFRDPSLAFAKRVAKAGVRSWSYRLDWAPDQSPYGACHCLELPLVFGNHDAWRNAPMLRGATPAALNALTHAIQDAWITFIRDGAPGHAATIPAPDGISRAVTFTEHTPSISDLGRP